MSTASLPPSRRATVLIVDDDPQAIEVLAEALGSDYDIRFTVDGAQTLHLLDGLAAPGSAGLPELILLDMLLPDTDGYTLYRQIKDRAETADVPVIFVTSMRDAASEAKGLEMGAADYITKPISPPIVRARVHNHIELARTRADLVASRNEALAAARAKAAFLATMSHEIRTPLNGVIGMTGLLQGTPLSAEQRDFVDTIRLSGDTLLTLINDILDFSKIESGRMDLESEPLTLRLLLEETYEILAGKAREKGLELVSDIGAGVPADLYGDRVRLRQILVNLAGNAVKFTERGEVVTEVRLLRKGEKDAPDVIEFRVNDTGIGIPPERVAMLFEPFTQVDSSTTRLYGGSGLGLAICKRLVALMGGKIGVESVPGQGSTFYFTLPVRRAPDSAHALLQVSRAHLHGRHALIVEDHARNRRSLQHQLEAWGMTVHAAESGQAALETLRQQPRLDLALIDNDLPDGDGEALARNLRDVAGHGALPLIVLSSAYFSTEPAASLFCAKLLKPVRLTQLHEAVMTALGIEVARQAAKPVPALNAKLAAQYPLHVLVVDDNAVNRKVAEATLARLGYQPALAQDGREAVDQVAQAEAAGRPFDLVFMDVQMPRLDGLDATRIIKSAPAGFPPVIVAMTAGASVDDRSNCFYAGMDDYVSKPINFAQFQETIERWGSRALRRRL